MSFTTQPSTERAIEPLVTSPLEPKAAPTVAPSRPRFLTLEPETDITVANSVVHLSLGKQLSPDRSPPLVTTLHGACWEAAPTCEALRDALPSGFAMACPTGNAVCRGGGNDWVGDVDEKTAQLDSQVDAVRRELDSVGSAGSPNVIMGFSRGAFVARDVALAHPGRYTALVLIGAATSPDPEKLKLAGIRKVVLASGEYDSAAKTMQSAAVKLNARGLPARYVSLGRVWHALPPDSGKRLAAAIDWATQPQ
ncbi:MAG: hypothetical protein U0271_14210 [Polyangiaceae bacterium]